MKAKELIKLIEDHPDLDIICIAQGHVTTIEWVEYIDGTEAIELITDVCGPQHTYKEYADNY